MRALLALLLASAALPSRAATVYVATVDADISPAIGDYVTGSIRRAAAEKADALVLRLDTPGGLISTTQDIVSAILNAELPVLVYVSPRGAWAASAGTFITLAGHVAAMAPGTSIGAAHPVPVFGAPPPAPAPDPSAPEREKAPAPAQRDFANEKTENFTAAFIQSIAELRGRNIEWAVEAVRSSVAIDHAQALEKNVIDLVAEDLPELLELASGRVVKVGRNEVELQLAGARVVELEMSAAQRFFAVLASPQLAMILLLVGLAGIYLETQSPGLIIPGALGATCLVLLGISLQIIPFDWVGVLLVLAGLALMIGELWVPGFGLLFVPGMFLFGAGAYLAFRVPELSDVALPLWQFVVPMTAAFGLLGALIGWGVVHSAGRPQVAGSAALVGARGIAESAVDAASGSVVLRGERWNARSDQRIDSGQAFEVEGLDGLTLRLRPLPGAKREEV